MKKYLTLTLLFLSGLMFAQSSQPAPTSTSKSDKIEVTNAPGSADYNFEFYPTNVFLSYSAKVVFDSSAQKFQWKTDTVKNSFSVRVQKENDQISITNLRNLTAPIYKAKVEYLGVTTDGNGAFVYAAKTQEKETIIVSPLFGWVIIVFKSECGRPKKQMAVSPGHSSEDCDTAVYYFGNTPNTDKGK